MNAIRVLIVDDDRMMRNSLVDLIEAAGWVSKDLARATDVERWITQFRPDVILSDVRMPEMTGLELLHSLQDAPPVVLISAHGDIPLAVEAMGQGAYSFVEKPYEPKRLLSILTHAADQFRMSESNLRLKDRLRQLAGMDRLLLGETPELRRLRETIAGVADTEASVLIYGETGTGKDIVARALHDLSGRSGGPFIAINAAQLTAAHLPLIARDAAGGTLLLDEICACPAEVQPMLLRLIEAKEVMEPGRGSPESVDLRVLSTTNEDVKTAVNEGRLRQDLLFRLDTIGLELPPLRARLDDIPLLLQRFLQDFSVIYEVAVPELSDADFTILMAHNWPGNVRELRNVTERFVLARRFGSGSLKDAMSQGSLAPLVKPGLREAVAAFERQMIGMALQTHSGRMDDVADALGIGRRTLNEKIVKLGLDKDSLL